MSLAIHMALLTLRIASPERFERLFSDTPLDVILVNTRAKADEPDKAQALAQTQLAGGGEQKSGRAASPLPSAASTSMGEMSESMQRQVAAMRQQQSLLLAQVKDLLAQLPQPQPQKSKAEQEAIEQKRRQLLKLLAEIEERITLGVGSVPDEKYRLFWDGIMNWNKIGWLSDKFAGFDACMVAGRYTHMGFWHETEVIDLRDPLDGMAQNFLTCPISISAPQVIEKVIEHCEYYEIDGLVLHGARTCRAFSYPQFLLADAVGKRMGMPVAMFEGDMVDESFYKDELVNSRVEAMLEQIEARRQRNR